MSSTTAGEESIAMAIFDDLHYSASTRAATFDSKRGTSNYRCSVIRRCSLVPSRAASATLRPQVTCPWIDKNRDCLADTDLPHHLGRAAPANYTSVPASCLDLHLDSKCADSVGIA